MHSRVGILMLANSDCRPSEYFSLFHGLFTQQIFLLSSFFFVKIIAEDKDFHGQGQLAKIMLVYIERDDSSPSQMTSRNWEQEN